MHSLTFTILDILTLISRSLDAELLGVLLKVTHGAMTDLAYKRANDATQDGSI